MLEVKVKPPQEQKATDARIATARQNLRIAIAIAETTTAEVSVAAGMSKNALGQFLRGNSAIGYANLLRVCDALHVPIGILHRPGGVTPGRIKLQKALENTPPEVLEAALRAIAQKD